MDRIDLRSDTVTVPTPGMRAAIAAAEVGDDQFGEDPAINRLQERVADLLGKEAAVWLPTGTMANQVALRVLTRPGDDVVVAQEAHAVWHETGASGANAGVQFTAIGEDGVFSADDVAAAIKPRGHLLYPPTTLVEVENTHNRAGGVIFPQVEAARVVALTRERGVATYLDGARLWNASVAQGLSVGELAAGFDLVSVGLSKGLGAPGGALLAGSREFAPAILRYRRMAGGAMRQVGFFGAAGLYALDHHIDRLTEDHVNARAIAEVLAGSERVRLDVSAVQTNIIVFDLTNDAPDAATVVSRARGRGVLVVAFGPRRVRAVTHLDVDAAACRRGAEILVEAIDGGEA